MRVLPGLWLKVWQVFTYITAFRSIFSCWKRPKYSTMCVLIHFFLSALPLGNVSKQEFNGVSCLLKQRSLRLWLVVGFCLDFSFCFWKYSPGKLEERFKNPGEVGDTRGMCLSKNPTRTLKVQLAHLWFNLYISVPTGTLMFQLAHLCFNWYIYVQLVRQINWWFRLSNS